MSTERLDRNLSRLLRFAVLPSDGAARSRARAEFLRVAEPASPGRARGLAVAAAAVLIGALVYAAIRDGAPPPSAPTLPFAREPQEPAAPFKPVPGAGGNPILKGVLTVSRGPGSDRRFRFQGRGGLPEGVALQVQVRRAEQHFLLGRLSEDWQAVQSFTPTQEQGSFDVEWPLSTPGRLSIRVTAPDSIQDLRVLEALNRIPEKERGWTFEYSAWDDSLLANLDPQLAEIAELAREATDLVARAQAACATPERFGAEEKSLIADARRLESRAHGFAAAGLYPAAALELARMAGDFAGSLAIFTWKDGRFEGPSSYYTNHQRGKTYRGDPFDFDALRRYAGEVVLMAGREFDLWIVQDWFRAGTRPLLLDTVDRSAKRIGVADYAERLKAGEPDSRLIDAIRTIVR